MNKYGKFINKALDKMFQMVGFESVDENFVKQEDWYSKKTWTKDQSEEFKNWFIKEGKKDLKFTKQMMEKEHAWFNLKYGWREV